MAEALMKKAIGNFENRYIVSSAGVSAGYGVPASENSSLVMKKDWNIDLSSHRSSALNTDEIEKAYLILTMTYNHKELIISRYPQALDKTFTLKEYTSEDGINGLNGHIFGYDISDPYGMPVPVYTQCANEIKECIDKLVKKLEKE